MRSTLELLARPKVEGQNVESIDKYRKRLINIEKKNVENIMIKNTVAFLKTLTNAQRCSSDK